LLIGKAAQEHFDAVMKTPTRAFSTSVVFCTLLLAGWHCTGATAVNPTLVECEEFARQIESHDAQGDLEFYFHAFDLDQILEQVVSPKSMDQKDYEAMRRAFKKGAEERQQRQEKEITSLRLLRVREVDGELRAVLRLRLRGGRISYQELLFKRSSKGGLSIVDAYNYSSGEKLTDTFRRILAPLLAEKNKSMFRRLFGGTPDIIKYEPQWSQLPRLNSEGHYREAMDVYRRLPASLRKEKSILLQQLKAAQAADDSAYVTAIDLWRRTYPHDPALDLIAIDGYILRRQYVQALACIDRLDQALGGDPSLEVQRALLFWKMKDPVRARASARRAFEREPSLEAALLEVLFLADEKKYDACVAQLQKLQTPGGYPREKLVGCVERSPKLAGLARSQPYLKWRGPMMYVSASGSQRGRPSTATATAGGLKLQGIIYRQPGASAMINGQFVRVGDPIEDYTVQAIASHSVTLQSPSGERTVLDLGGAGE
jgi:hypothetical protein